MRFIFMFENTNITNRIPDFQQTKFLLIAYLQCFQMEPQHSEASTQRSGNDESPISHERYVTKTKSKITKPGSINSDQLLTYLFRFSEPWLYIGEL